MEEDDGWAGAGGDGVDTDAVDAVAAVVHGLVVVVEGFGLVGGHVAIQIDSRDVLLVTVRYLHTCTKLGRYVLISSSIYKTPQA